MPYDSFPCLSSICFLIGLCSFYFLMLSFSFSLIIELSTLLGQVFVASFWFGCGFGQPCWKWAIQVSPCILVLFSFSFFFPLQLIKNPKPIWTETSSNWNKISISITIDGNSYLFLSYSVKNSPFTGISSVLKATYCLQPHKYLLYGNIVHILGPTVIMMTQDKILVLWTSQLIIRKIRVNYIEVGILPVLRRTTLSVSLRLFQDQWRSA